MHVFPQLRKLEQKYAEELVVINVHSAKFPTERATENVRQAVLRYDIQSPVVNDEGFQIWQMYGVGAWPTLVLIDPRGKIVGHHAGEMPLEVFDQILGEAVQQFAAEGVMDRAPLLLTPEKQESRGPLAFPGKVLADGASGRLYIADSNHDRVIVASLDGAVQQVIGSGETGLRNGDFRTARFNRPQGLALHDSKLYVADTENHAIREVDLAHQTVQTIAGTGDQATAFHDGGPGETVPLNSPWDLTVHGDTLYIAMAGFHQLWAMSLSTRHVTPFAGSGREGLMDGPRERCWLAQPSGITNDGERLYFADSETSSIRMADPTSPGEVRTIVGQDLFVFGDADGTGKEVRLQHPLGICCLDGVLYVADTYNSRIKLIDPAAGLARVLLGAGQPGYEDGDGLEARFREPGGLSIADGKLYIADTNNHAIRVADLATRTVSTLQLKGL